MLDTLLSSPLTTINDIAKKLDISFQAASEQAKLFLGLGILEELTGQSEVEDLLLRRTLKL